ncbi:MAG: regulatory protein MerR [Rhodospirillales bacterium]|nr:regulatory protein MerR [Rhodospirillales bacterium]
MSEVDDLSLGPTTEARFSAAFGTQAVVGKRVAAHLLGVDVKTVDALPIRSVPKGAKHRGYTERDLRAYLIDGPDMERAPTEPKSRAKPAAPVRYVNFSERRSRR